ncbi:hypothetical protein SAMN04488028_102473 [Reichenbachiella agariperforans]|uniref:Outer membrane protein beta-barrel domain-containing protein n=1 Tax=Reichenbachiella agariperforans TaxID=156994 RepID=A0A1M6NYQ9_REIAG|nr:hypothetical protein [Reichenbachiella agariperforans]SHK00869.1 hypothetical protein SAMN04488028_102473 [Reichenbachiella agariperforans]
MRPKILILVLALVSVMPAVGQGVSMSFIIPKDGYFSAPVSPLSVRGLGYKWGMIGFATGASLYNMPGLPMSGLPFESDKPLAGPFWSVLVPLQLTLGIEGDRMSFQLLAGGFGMWHISPRLNYGNLDRAIADYEGWDVANANVDMKSKLGAGWMAGVELAFHVNRKFSITTEVEYLSGQSGMTLKGDYSGGSYGGMIETRPVDYSDANLMLEGLEISIGVVMNGR